MFLFPNFFVPLGATPTPGDTTAVAILTNTATVTSTNTATPTITPSVTATPTSTSSPTPTNTVTPTKIASFSQITSENTDLIEPIFVLSGHEGPVLHVAFSPDDQQLASSGADGTVRLWDMNRLSNEPLILNIDQTGWTQVVAYNPDGNWLAAGGNDRTVEVWNIASDNNFVQPFAQFSRNEGFIFGLAFTPDGTQLASGSGDGYLNIWNVEAGNLLTSAQLSESAILELAFNPIGTLLAVANLNGGFRLLTYPSLQAQCLISNDSILATSFSNSGDIVVLGNKEGEVIVINPNTCARQSTIQAHTDFVNGIAIGGPDDNVLISGSRDGSLFVMPRNIRLEAHTASVESVAINKEGNLIASASADGTIILWGIPGD